MFGNQMPAISVIIPTLNEAAELPPTVERLRQIPEVLEVIIADGGSSDETSTVAERFGCKVVTAPRGRGSQMHVGARQARGEIVWLLHADTWPQPDAGRVIIACMSQPGVVGGGCYKTFREPSWLMRGSRLKCVLRFYLFRRFMGDQAIFVRREILEAIGGVPDVPLMEEFELCRLLRQHGQLALAGTVVSTSARRFKERGVLRTYLRMGRVTLHYFLGTPPEKLKRIYERH